MEMDYSAKLTGNQFLFYETKVVASLLTHGLSKDEIRQRVATENLFNYKTTKSIKKRINEIFRRLQVLTPGMMNILVNSLNESARLICLYAIMKTDLLFFDFMKEVVLEKHIIGQNTIEIIDINRFFESKAVQSDKVAGWTPYTMKKLRGAFRVILRDSGLVRKSDVLELLPPIIPFEVSEEIRKAGDRNYLKLMLGE